MNELLHDAATRAARYLEGLGDRPVAAPPEAVAALDALDTPVPDGPSDPADVLALLDRLGSPATVASAGGRYFGFVTGGSLPAALAANWLAGAWDQNAALAVMSPAAMRLEETALAWLIELLGLPRGSAGAIVTGATMANVAGLAAARHALLERQGWDAERRTWSGESAFDAGAVAGWISAGVLLVGGCFRVGRAFIA
jgi:glutamate/tyrosine decarboxylase-like PLP-dependent enzyme